MQTKIQLLDRPIAITLTPQAEKALALRQSPLLVEMELYFSCLIRKAVRFYEIPSEDSVIVSDKLHLRFRPVMTRHCGTDYEGEEPPLTDFPITRAERYVPHWLRIDNQNGEWRGEFGYANTPP